MIKPEDTSQKQQAGGLAQICSRLPNGCFLMLAEAASVYKLNESEQKFSKMQQTGFKQESSGLSGKNSTDDRSCLLLKDP